MPRCRRRLPYKVISIIFLDIYKSLFSRLRILSNAIWYQLVYSTMSLQSENFVLKTSANMQVMLIGEIYWNLFLRRVHILAAILLLKSGWSLLSTSSLIKPALLVRVIKWFFFSSLKAKTKVEGFRSVVAKLSSISVAQTESKFSCGFFVMAQLQLCC